MSQEHFWILFSKKIAGEASQEELLELEQLIRLHPEWQYALQNLSDIWQSNPPADLIGAEDAYLLHLHRLKEKNISLDGPYSKTNHNAARISRKIWLRITYVTIAVAASLTLLFFLFSDRPAEKNKLAVNPGEMNEISTRLGSKSRIQLPDSSVVWLNAGSKLTYAKDFGKINREVFLSGEALFNVVRNAEKPFLIYTSSIDIRVLGTAFNVKAYPDDNTSETSLIHGQIEVSIKARPRDKIILSPNEKLVVENKRSLAPDSADNPGRKTLVSINKLKLDPVDSSVAETKWVENKLVFSDESFRDLAVRMERWYGIEIVINDRKLEEKRFTGNFENENIEQAMEALTITTPFLFERKGNKIIIHR